MSRSLRAAGVIAAVYGYFLIFAQFAWVEIMRGAGGTPALEKICLGSMALAGIGAGFLTARRGPSPRTLRFSFLLAAVTAALAPWLGSMPEAVFISILTGAAIGGMTVPLASLLPGWCRMEWLGLGTGLGYAICNLPVVFMATHPQQAWIAAGFAVAGLFLIPGSMKVETPAPPLKSGPFRSDRGAVAAIAAFTALVWLDSAAFFIIQHSGDMKVATWGEPMLWRNAAIHLILAVVSGFWLRKGLLPVLIGAWILLAMAAFAVNSPEGRGFAGWCYPAGVSLYSTALVAWPGYFAAGKDSRRASYRAAWVYAVAGWFGSANGIGMAQTLDRVPGVFIAGAGLVLLGGWLLAAGRWRALLSIIVVGAIAASVSGPGTTPPLTATERGRAVYLAEGCINCHTRYVRPDSPDEILWGPAEGNSDRPVLIGNRRQGPDLSEVGLRRSAAWLKLHFINPRDFSPDSPMPSYAHLFDGSTRGDDLVEWLQQTSAGAYQKRADAVASWFPKNVAPAENAAELFDRHCAACHGSDRRGSGKLSGDLVRQPANLIEGPFVWSPAGPDLTTRIARIVKFGIPGTDMPGHETFDDSEIVALTHYLLELRKNH